MAKRCRIHNGGDFHLERRGKYEEGLKLKVHSQLIFIVSSTALLWSKVHAVVELTRTARLVFPVNRSGLPMLTFAAAFRIKEHVFNFPVYPAGSS